MYEHRHVLGKVDGCEAALTWELRPIEGTEDLFEFAAQGELWNQWHTDITMGGQCVDEIAAMFPHDKKAAAIARVWARWHLSGMTAGTPKQEAFLRENPVSAVYPESHYEKACEALAKAGLLDDPDTEGLRSIGGLGWFNADGARIAYRYGSRWIIEELPADVLAEIRAGFPVAETVGAA